MTQHRNSHHNKPQITVSEVDYDRLAGLADAARDRAPEVVEELRLEIDRARVVPIEAMPADVIRMGSIVEFRSDTSQQGRVTLVYPAEADIAKGRVSILTPIGAALIGLSSGQSIAWTARDGRRHELTVVSVEQPRAD